MAEKTKTVKIADLVLGHDGFNVRALNEDTVQYYQEIIDLLPPIEGWQEPETGRLFLVDGRHRCEARRRAGYEDVVVTLLACERVDAEVRAFSANLAHPLPLTRLQRRLAITQIVQRRYTRTNNWIAEEACCNPQTVARIREELEQAGKVPTLDRLERKGGGTVPREFNRISTAERDDSPFGNNPDFFDEAEAAAEQAKKEPREVRAPADLLADEAPVQDGGYDVDADESDEDTFEATGPLITGLEKGPSLRDLLPWQGAGRGKGQPVTLKFAQANEEGIPAEVTLYIDGQAHNIPVTLLVADGPIAGLPEVSLAENGQAALVLGQELGRRLRLVY